MLGRIDPITYVVQAKKRNWSDHFQAYGILCLFKRMDQNDRDCDWKDTMILRAKDTIIIHLHEEEIQQLSSCFVSSSRQNLLCSLIRRFDSVSAAVVRSLSPPSHLVSIRHPYRNSGSWFQTKYSLLTEQVKKQSCWANESLFERSRSLLRIMCFCWNLLTNLGLEMAYQPRRYACPYIH